LSYQWKKDGVDVAGATGSVYSVVGATKALNGAKYTVVVSNAKGSATSSAAALTVTDGLVINRQPQGAVLNYGQALSMSVEASGPGVLSYVWRRNGVVVPGVRRR